MEKNILTQEIIAGCIAGTDSGAQNAKIAKVVSIIMIVLGAICLLLPDMLFYSIFCFAVAILAHFLIAKSNHIIQAILRKNYTLKIDVCEAKGISAANDPASPYLAFATAGRCYLSFPHVIGNSKALCSSPDLYESADNGDVFYLLCVDGNRILYVFNSKHWSIATNEFSRQENCFVPNK